MFHQASWITITTSRLLFLHIDLALYYSVKRFSKNMAPIHFKCTLCSSYLTCTACSRSVFQVCFFKYIQQTSCREEQPLKWIKVASAGPFQGRLTCSLPRDPQPPQCGVQVIGKLFFAALTVGPKLVHFLEKARGHVVGLLFFLVSTFFL